MKLIKFFPIILIFVLFTAMLNGCAALIMHPIQAASNERSAQANEQWFKNNKEETTNILLNTLKNDPIIKEVSIKDGKIVGETENGVPFNISLREKGEFTGAIVRVERGFFPDTGTEVMESKLKSRLMLSGHAGAGLVPVGNISSIRAGFVPIANTNTMPKVSAGTEVPFAKVMDSTFASDYIGLDISTVGEFVANGAGISVLDYPMNGKVVFRCRPPGSTDERNPLSGEVIANFVVLPKDKSDIIFTLKPGDFIKLRGGTYVSQWQSNTSRGMNTENLKEIIFEATAIEKQYTK